MQSNTYLISALFALAVGCSEPAPTTIPPPVDAPETLDHVGALNLYFATGGDMDHAALTAKRVSCDGEPIDPFSIHHQTSPQTPESALVDELILLPPGCYDVFVEPLKENGSPSDVCTSVLLDNVVIVEGYTTEAFVVFDCSNSPPQITDIAYSPNKFVSFCEAQEVCVTAFDSDNDAIEFEWSQLSGLPLLAGPTVTKPATTDAATGQTTECVTITHSGPGTVGMSVRSFDRIQLSLDTTMRREDFHAALGLHQESRDEASFPLHGMATADCP